MWILKKDYLQLGKGEIKYNNRIWGKKTPNNVKVTHKEGLYFLVDKVILTRILLVSPYTKVCVALINIKLAKASLGWAFALNFLGGLCDTLNPSN